jgi:hypothetical protein
MASKEWCVDWEVDVGITVSKTVTVGRSEIVEAETAEEAVAQAKQELYVDSSDLDLDTMILAEDVEMDDPDEKTFKVTGRVSEWGAR